MPRKKQIPSKRPAACGGCAPPPGFRPDEAEAAPTSIDKLTFQRVVDEVLHDIDPSLDITTHATLTLQAAAEKHMRIILCDAQVAATFSRREMTARDILLARRLRGD